MKIKGINNINKKRQDIFIYIEGIDIYSIIAEKINIFQNNTFSSMPLKGKR